VPWTQKVDNDVGVLDHSFDLSLVFVIHAPIDPGPVCVVEILLVGPVVLSSLRCSECL
jgi:hypothetical protein